ncbi:alpha/beta-Hydrolases superfamily protein [Rhynchospora pubera]|uniref:Alpha/beta-Hydrolases superfamily protein n=1 Tax=Rhynchospora pubera TaxID=906938 RepID=A0AAV8FSA8_9POAL|nr:alpha/beta-Hydrolases superfamily protein [Rhynchospora pubera]KAJ4817617.1 alpha/beta-Hydrolases superfamily protein [Rhynchospora pubera]
MGSFHNGYFTDYLILRPDKVTLFDLIHLLYTGDIDKNSAIDCPEQTPHIDQLERRWLLFISLTVQMILLKLKKPIAMFGWMVERWMNLYYANGDSIFVLLKNFLSRNLTFPDDKSANYKSTIGLLDTRIDLDKNIKPGDGKYHAALSIMAAKFAYENKETIKSAVRDHWKMEFLEYYNCWNEFEGDHSTQAFIFCDKPVDAELVVVAFCGTKPFNAIQWCTDFDFSWYAIPGVGKIHGGFLKALGLQKNTGLPEQIHQENDKPLAYYVIREKLREVLEKNKNAKFLVTGHSLGGALAILFPSILALHREGDLLKKLDGIYTFGQPRVGNAEFGSFVKRFLDTEKLYFRYVYSNDIVPRVPYDDKALMFKHFGKCLYYNVFYRGKVRNEEPNKNYFALWTLVPKLFTVTMELIRSFVIGYTKGPNYREGGLLRIARIVALVLPGLTPHGPQDYNNSTRLGNLVVPSDAKND